MNSIIKARRIQLGMSTDEVAKKLNVAKSTIYRYESDGFSGMNISTLKKLAAVYETSPLYLLGMEEMDKKSQISSVTLETPTPLTVHEKEELKKYMEYLIFKRND